MFDKENLRNQQMIEERIEYENDFIFIEGIIKSEELDYYTTPQFEEYYCEVNLDEDEMEKFLTDSFQGGCPYYRLEDEYKTVRKQM